MCKEHFTDLYLLGPLSSSEKMVPSSICTFSYGVETKYLKKVLNNKKKSYRVRFTLDENCILLLMMM